MANKLHKQGRIKISAAAVRLIGSPGASHREYQDRLLQVVAAALERTKPPGTFPGKCSVAEITLPGGTMRVMVHDDRREVVVYLPGEGEEDCPQEDQ
jgi:hypothetical protein